MQNLIESIEGAVAESRSRADMVKAAKVCERATKDLSALRKSLKNGFESDSLRNLATVVRTLADLTRAMDEDDAANAMVRVAVDVRP